MVGGGAGLFFLKKLVTREANVKLPSAWESACRIQRHYQVCCPDQRQDLFTLILVCPVVLIVRPPSLNEPLGMKPYLELTDPEYETITRTLAGPAAITVKILNIGTCMSEQTV